MTQQVHLHLSSLDKMDSRNLEEQRLGGMGQCAKAVLKVLRSKMRKVVEKLRKKSHLNFFHFFKFSGQNSLKDRFLHHFMDIFGHFRSFLTHFLVIFNHF